MNTDHNTSGQVVVEVLRLKGKDLLIAISDDMPGLYVHGRTEEELDARLPVAIMEIAAAEGKVLERVALLEAEMGSFTSPSEKHFVYETAA